MYTTALGLQSINWQLIAEGIAQITNGGQPTTPNPTPTEGGEGNGGLTNTQVNLEVNI